MATIAHLHCRAQSLPRPPGYSLPGGATESQLREFESNSGLDLPLEVRDWLLLINAALLGPGGIFGVKPGTESLTIDHIFTVYPEWAALGWLPIAGDGNGNYYVVVLGPTNPVAFIDASENHQALSYLVASRFSHFLDFLFSREAGDERWPFDRTWVLQRDPDLLRATTDPSVLRAARSANLLPWDA